MQRKAFLGFESTSYIHKFLIRYSFTTITFFVLYHLSAVKPEGGFCDDSYKEANTLTR